MTVTDRVDVRVPSVTVTVGPADGGTAGGDPAPAQPAIDRTRAAPATADHPRPHPARSRPLMTAPPPGRNGPDPSGLPGYPRPAGISARRPRNGHRQEGSHGRGPTPQHRPTR